MSDAKKLAEKWQHNQEVAGALARAYLELLEEQGGTGYKAAWEELHRQHCDGLAAHNRLADDLAAAEKDRDSLRSQLATARTEVERLTCDVETFKREAVHHRKRAIEAGAEGKSFDELVDATANESVDDHNRRVEGLYRETFEEES